jgi:hypothetical protein
MRDWIVPAARPASKVELMGGGGYIRFVEREEGVWKTPRVWR